MNVGWALPTINQLLIMASSAALHDWRIRHNHIGKLKGEWLRCSIICSIR